MYKMAKKMLIANHLAGLVVCVVKKVTYLLTYLGSLSIRTKYALLHAVVLCLVHVCQDMVMSQTSLYIDLDCHS